MEPAVRDLSVGLTIEALRAGHRVEFIAHGASMWPTIRDGARVRIEPCRVDELSVGTIVAFERHGTVVVHRVRLLRGPSIVTRGDALHTDDASINGAQVLGRVTLLQQGPLRVRWPVVMDGRRLAIVARNALQRLWRRISR